MTTDSSTNAITTAVRSAVALHINTFATSVLGFIYLVVATKLFDREQLGRDMALVSAMMLLAAVSEVNLGMVLARLLPHPLFRDRRRGVVAKSYMLTSGIALAASIIFIWLVPHFAKDLAFLRSGEERQLAVMFVVAVISWNLFGINDAVLTAVRKATWVPVENAVFGMLKLVAMVLFGLMSVRFGVFQSWVWPLLMTVVPMTFVLFRIALRDDPSRDSEKTDPKKTEAAEPLLQSRSSLVRYVGLDYFASVCMQIGTSMLPLIVIGILGAHANAAFAIAFTIITALEQLSMNNSMVITVEGAFDHRNLAHLVRMSLKRFGLLFVALVLAGVACSPISPLIFGREYRTDLPILLALMLIGLIPQAIVLLFEGIARVNGQAGKVLLTTFSQMVLTVAFTILLSRWYGLTGVGIAWISAHTIVALAVLPQVLKVAGEHNDR